MGVNNVSFDDAMVSKSAAGQYLRSKAVSAEEKGQLSAKWGAEFVNQSLSVDSTKYEIDDVDYQSAKDAGKNSAKESVGYDGGKDRGAWLDAGISAAGVGAAGYSVAANGFTTVAKQTAKLTAAKAATEAAKIAETEALANASTKAMELTAAKESAERLAKEAAKDGASDAIKEEAKNAAAKIAEAEKAADAAEKAAEKASENASNKASEEAATKSTTKKANLSAYIAAGIAIATAAKYMIEKPNKEQVDATNHLLQNELPEGQCALNEAQEEINDASEKTTELSEEAEEKNEESNDKIEEKKTLFDFYNQQYKALKAKKESGVALTADEKALTRALAPQMEETGKEINTISEDTSEEVNELNDDIAEYQDAFDESAETIGEVEGVTEYAEGFDESTRTMCYVEAGSQGLNAISGATAAAKLMAGGFWNWALGIAAGLAAARSGYAVIEQTNYASQVSDEIHSRRDTQELGSETNEIYEEELDNYAGNIETIEDLELEIPEDVTPPTDVASVTSDSTDTNTVPAAQTKSKTTDDEQAKDKNNEDNKKKNNNIIT